MSEPAFKKQISQTTTDAGYQIKTKGRTRQSVIPTYKGFEGNFSKMEDMRERIPVFKDFYIERRIAADGTKTSLIRLVDQFNEITPPGNFFPSSKQFARWRKQWDGVIAGKFSDPNLAAATTELLEKRGAGSIAKQLASVYKDKKKTSEHLVPSAAELEEGAATLGEMLLVDAAHTLKDTQEREEVFEDEVVVKRKMYALNVFNFVMKASHKRAEVDIKRHAEGRETAGFMLDLIARATAGNITEAELSLLKGTSNYVTDPS